jgi:putative transposase
VWDSANGAIRWACAYRWAPSGDAYDDAMAESFFATLECELIDRRSWQTKTEARLALFTYIEGWYNPHRRHSTLGQISPARLERNHHEMHRTPPQSLTTVGDCMACASPPVDKSAPEFIDPDVPPENLDRSKLELRSLRSALGGRRRSDEEEQVHRRADRLCTSVG